MKPIARDCANALNPDLEGGSFPRTSNFETDRGVPAERLTGFSFESHRFEQVLGGQRDVPDLPTDRIAAERATLPPAEVANCWPCDGAGPDEEVLGGLLRAPCPCVIATDGEGRRADYVRKEPGFSTQGAHVFASGPLGVKKPAPDVFAENGKWCGPSREDIPPADDSPANLTAARDRSWQGCHVTAASRADLPALPRMIA